jgi:hypothetical protein
MRLTRHWDSREGSQSRSEADKVEGSQDYTFLCEMVFQTVRGDDASPLSVLARDMSLEGVTMETEEVPYLLRAHWLMRCGEPEHGEEVHIVDMSLSVTRVEEMGRERIVEDAEFADTQIDPDRVESHLEFRDADGRPQLEIHLIEVNAALHSRIVPEGRVRAVDLRPLWLFA